MTCLGLHPRQAVGEVFWGDVSRHQVASCSASKEVVMQELRAISAAAGRVPPAAAARHKRMLFTNTGVVAIVLALLSGGGVAHATGGIPLVTRATVDVTAGSHGQVTIVGQFWPTPPVVTLGGTVVGVISATPTQIVASLQNVAGIKDMPGDYQLKICHGDETGERRGGGDHDGRDDNGSCTTFGVTIGAGGAPGPKGPRGGQGGEEKVGPRRLPGGS